MAAPLAIDLFCGLGGWTDGLLAEGYNVIGFDVERHDYGTGGYPGQLVLQDVLTLHGSQFRDAALIVASPPCQEFSYMAMPWSRAKQIRRALRGEGEFPEGYTGSRTVAELTALFDACFRIQREAIEAAGHFIPLVVENVRGAQEWVGRSRWNYGSFHLWGDVPALMPMTFKGNKMPTGDCVRNEKSRSAALQHYDQLRSGIKNTGGSWFNIGSPGQKETGRNPVHALAADGVKQGGDWFNAEQPSISRMTGSKSSARKAASAMIAKIPLALSRHIAKTYFQKECAE